MNPDQDPMRDAIAQATMRNNLVQMSLRPQSARFTGTPPGPTDDASQLTPMPIAAGNAFGGSATPGVWGSTPPLPGGTGYVPPPDTGGTPPPAPAYTPPTFPPYGGGTGGGGAQSFTPFAGTHSAIGGQADAGRGVPGTANFGGVDMTIPGTPNFDPTAGQPADGGGGGTGGGAVGFSGGFTGGNLAGDQTAGSSSAGDGSK